MAEVVWVWAVRLGGRSTGVRVKGRRKESATQLLLTCKGFVPFCPTGVNGRGGCHGLGQMRQRLASVFFALNALLWYSTVAVVLAAP